MVDKDDQPGKGGRLAAALTEEFSASLAPRRPLSRPITRTRTHVSP